MRVLRFMDQINIIINSVKMLKVTFFGLCIFALHINENLADIIPDPTVCKQGKLCSESWSGHDYEGCTEIQESHGNCLNHPNKACFCPYEPPPLYQRGSCKNGQQCEQYVIS